MKRIISRTICLILAIMMSVAVVGCGGTSDSGNVDTGSSNNQTNESTNTTAKDYTVGAGENSGKTVTEDPATEVIDTRFYEDNTDELINFGTHVYTSPTVEDKWVVRNGKTEYKLVVAADTSEASKTEFRLAKEEFIKWFYEATNIIIEVLVDDGLMDKEHSPEQTYISLDETTLFNSLKGTENEIDNSMATLGLEGGKIVSVDNNIYIVGYTDRGTLNAVYTFLMLTFNWETYSANTSVIDRDVKNLNFRNYQVTDIPDVHYQPTSAYEKGSWNEGPDWSKINDHPTEGGYYYGTRVRAYASDSLGAKEIFTQDPETLDDDAWLKLLSPGGHNSNLVVNETKWKDIHPEWFGNGQLCYTTRGDAESYDLVTTLIANMIIRQLLAYPVAKYPHKRSVDITITDSPEMCQCTTCMEQKSIYKDSGLVVKYMNVVAQKVRAWMEKPGNEAYRRDNLEIRHYAYLGTEAPPAKIDEDTGEWIPIDETVIMDKNTCIKYANINTDFQQSLFAEDNKWALDIFDGWTAVADNIGYFMYNYNCGTHNYFYDGFDHYNTKGINYYLAGGRSYYYSENIHGNTPTEWGALISFLNAKLCYNSLLDSGKLMKNWFKACFGDAAGIMMDMLQLIREFNHVETARNDMYKRFSIYNQVYYRFDWRKEIITGWIDKADEALLAIDYLREEDPEEYDRIKYNIELEIVSPIFVLFTHCLEELSQEERMGYVYRLQDDVKKYPELKNADMKPYKVPGWVDANLV